MKIRVVILACVFVAVFAYVWYNKKTLVNKSEMQIFRGPSGVPQIVGPKGPPPVR